MNIRILTTLFCVIVLFAFSISGCSHSTSPNNAIKPTITTISPSASPVGYMVIITGTNFGDTQSSSYVTFNGAQSSATDIIYWFPNTIKMTVPAGATTGKVVVVVEGQKSNEYDFMVTQPGASDPYIQALDVTIAQAGQKIGVIGKNFGSSQGSSYVEFNGTRAITYTGWTDTKITVVVPVGATTGKVIAFINSKSTNGLDFTVQKSNDIVPMVTIPSGTFNMGTNSGDALDNKPMHLVKISQPFLMSKTEISQKQWKTVMDNSNPSQPNEVGDAMPVNQVIFVRAIVFCNNLSAMEHLTPCYTISADSETITVNWNANGYRLPTEAEWEYAAQAGHEGEFSTDEIQAMAVYSDNANHQLQNCGTKSPNQWGLYDMLGNVFEWCWDFYDADYYKLGDMTDPQGPAEITPDRVIRGGSFINGTEACGVLVRNSFPCTNGNYNFNLGFRVVRKAN